MLPKLYSAESKPRTFGAYHLLCLNEIYMNKLYFFISKHCPYSSKTKDTIQGIRNLISQKSSYPKELSQ